MENEEILKEIEKTKSLIRLLIGFSIGTVILISIIFIKIKAKDE